MGGCAPVEGGGTELDDGDGAEVDECDVKKKAAHQRGAKLHRVDRHEHEVQSQLTNGVRGGGIYPWRGPISGVRGGGIYPWRGPISG
eukprot:5422472-Pyramimonas_sp.AAC.1